VDVSGDIVSGIEIGSVSAMSKKMITFEGKTQNFDIQEEKEAIAFINSSQLAQSDSISISFDNSQQGSAAIASAPSSGWLTGFLKRWYMWIMAGVILVLLFIAIFKRLSSNI
jgi:hypothetical protein